MIPVTYFMRRSQNKLINICLPEFHILHKKYVINDLMVYVKYAVTFLFRLCQCINVNLHIHYYTWEASRLTAVIL